MRPRSWLPGVLLLGACATCALAQGLPHATPPEVGLSKDRLERLDTSVRRLVHEEKIAGAVVLLARRGRVAHFAAYGLADRESRRPMGGDAIFRICSMSKPVTSVAAMMLYEEGRFLLDDPVASFLPEFVEPKVVLPDEKGVVPAKRPITIRHLLTHTSGISYRFMGQRTIADLYAAAGVTDGLAETSVDLAENVRRIAAQPLLHEPGARFSYGLNTDVVGRLVEVLSGQSLGHFLDERVFRPLKMLDTGFTVPEEKQGRLAAVYRTDKGPGLVRLPDEVHTEGHLVFSPSYPFRGPRRYQSGGAGLVSTATDYARFAHVLLRRGELDGVRLLSRKTVELMTADHLLGVEKDEDFGFGLGLSRARDPGVSGEIASAGTWGWGGFYTTNFWVDPEEELVGVVLTQTYPYNSHRVLDRLRAVAYQAIAD